MALAALAPRLPRRFDVLNPAVGVDVIDRLGLEPQPLDKRPAGVAYSSDGIATFLRDAAVFERRRRCGRRARQALRRAVVVCVTLKEKLSKTPI